MASVNQSSVWDVTSQTDDTVMNRLHTLQRDQLEMAANILFRHLILTILDPDRSGIVSIDFVDNPYHGDSVEEDSELCTTNPTDGTATCHRYCIAYPFERDLLLADRGFYNERVIRRARE